MNQLRGKILTPADYQTAFGPLIYVAAPWRRGFELQTAAVQFLARYAGSRQLNVAHARPRKGVIPSAEEIEKWQAFYMARANQRGAVLFWIPPSADLENDGRLPTRYLLGRWLSSESKPRTVVVLANGAGNSTAIRRDIERANSKVFITNNLKTGCQMAVRIAMVANLRSGLVDVEKDWAKPGPGFYPEGVSTAEIDAAWDEIVTGGPVYRLEHRLSPVPRLHSAPKTDRKIALSA